MNAVRRGVREQKSSEVFYRHHRRRRHNHTHYLLVAQQDEIKRIGHEFLRIHFATSFLPLTHHPLRKQ